MWWWILSKLGIYLLIRVVTDLQTNASVYYTYTRRIIYACTYSTCLILYRNSYARRAIEAWMELTHTHAKHRVMCTEVCVYMCLGVCEPLGQFCMLHMAGIRSGRCVCVCIVVNARPKIIKIKRASPRAAHSGVHAPPLAQRSREHRAFKMHTQHVFRAIALCIRPLMCSHDVTVTGLHVCVCMSVCMMIACVCVETCWAAEKTRVGVREGSKSGDGGKRWRSL